MSSLVLPQELVNIIIDEVGKLDDIPTLKACSLVALSFVFPAQQHLFQVIDLDRRSPRKKYFQKFYRLLISKPHIGTHVQQLRLGDDTDEDYSWRIGKDSSWIAKAKEIPRLLHMLSKLRAFSLTFNSEMVAWSSLSASNQTALSSLFDLESLRSVSLEFMTGIPPAIISKLYKVKALGLSCVEVDTSGKFPFLLPNTASSSPLQTLHLRGATPATITSMVRFSEGASGSSMLQKLSITPTFEAGFCEAVFELMKHHRNVTHFEWLPSIHFYLSAGPIDLSIFPSLTTLTLLISFRKATAGHGPFSEAIRLLTQLSSSEQPNRIETVILDCHCIRSSEAKARRVEWRPMDKLLSKSAFANLKEVKVQLAAKTCSAAERANFVLAFQHLLPKVEERGTLISLHNYDLADDRFFMGEKGLSM
ncbi:hypothetical protein CVT24_012689 [Panaeolus cyanescens]|uniref:F-box domain-containing protein n=1 Tax=Panaeolus cyanescens TaxID=181874 RepID=A0A409YK61_9AGAR|nr:hypothetical protein CVT24_012689 [Panaeolus cyanescens]